MRGDLIVEIVSADGVVQSQEEYRNAITVAAPGQVLRMLAGDWGAIGQRRWVRRMQFGIGNLAESSSNTSLQHPISPVKVVSASVSVDDPPRVQFGASLGVTEANGFGISEAGLLCDDGTLFARKTFGKRDKTKDYIFNFYWTIQA